MRKYLCWVVLFCSAFLIAAIPASPGSRSFSAVGTNYLTVGSSLPDMTSNWTIVFWVKRSVINANQMLYGRFATTSTHRQIAIYFNTSGNTLQVDIPYIGAILTSSGTIIDTNWHHVAVTRTSAGVYIIYLNGVFDSTTTNATAQETASPLYIGYSVPQTAGQFSGQIAEMAGWNVVLKANEISSLAHCTPASVVHGGTNLQFYWPIWGADASEPDLSGGKNNLSISGSAPLANHVCGPSAGSGR